MTIFLAATKNSFLKLISRNKYRIFFIISCLLSVFFSIYSRGGQNINIGMMSVSFSSGAYLMLSLLSSFLLPLLIFMATSDLYAHEFSDLSIKAEILRPIDRSKLFFAKMLGIWIYCVLLIFSSFIICAIIGKTNASLDNLFIYLIASLMVLFSMIAFIAMGACISSWVSNPSLSMFLLILLFALMSVMSTISSRIGTILFTGQINWYKMILGSVIPWKNIVTSMFLIASQATIFAVVGQLLFEKKRIS